MGQSVCICDKCGNRYEGYDTSICPTCREIERDYDEKIRSIKDNASSREHETERRLKNKYNID